MTINFWLLVIGRYFNRVLQLRPRRNVRVILGQLLLVFLALVLVGSGSWGTVAAFSPDRMVTANVPLDSPVYLYLAKLEGLGYLEGLLPDTRPYSRMQAARWVRQAQAHLRDNPVPTYVRTIVAALATEFAPELAAFDGGETREAGFNCHLQELTWNNVYYDGASMDQTQLRATYQPLAINQDGYQFAEEFNSILTARIEGNCQDHLVFSLTPRFSCDQAKDGSSELKAGYLKTGFGNLQLQLGKDARWWGPGQRGSLPLTNNAKPQVTLELANLEPIRFHGLLRFLKQMDGRFFISEQDEERDVKGASFVGFRAAVAPSANFNFGGSLTAIVGGDGHVLHGRDYLDFFTGENAAIAASDRWNSLAGFDFRWRVPQLNGLQVYGELYGEDQAKAFGIVPTPSKNAYLAGLRLPGLTADGSWDLTFETAHTIGCSYKHSLYRDGYTYRGNIIGDAMGPDATRYYCRLSHYRTDGSLFSLHLEQLTPNRTGSALQRMKAVWLSYQYNLQTDLLLQTTVGVADCADAANVNYLLSVALRRQF
ncbi:MAG: capsule assembly Wzi family protein [Bacillota bacterium]